MAVEPVHGPGVFLPRGPHRLRGTRVCAQPRNPCPPGSSCPTDPAYFTSRGSVMGQVPGEVVSSAFAVFNPQAVIPSVAPSDGSTCDAATICAARTGGGIGQLVRVLVRETAGLGEGDRAPWPERPSRCVPRDDPLFAGLPCTWAYRLPRWVTCGDWPICCATPGANLTPPPGYRPASMRRRLACSRSCTGAPHPEAMCAPRAWSSEQLECRRVLYSTVMASWLTVPRPPCGCDACESIEIATDRQCEPIIPRAG